MKRTIERHVVVCVDDEPAILSALRRSLRAEPYDVLTTEDPESALCWVRTRDVSLVISDQRMPGMAGTELLEKVSKRSPSTARMLLTAFAGDTMGTPWLRHWAECMISKPWDNRMLRKTIRQILGDRELDFKQEEASK
ncbi:MAG TPA: response regulator [Planctomycetota bacterium]|jgi:response regulator RpfG family c-di-GMP phosphodiesterase|nr:response regulator [Planctomycetota bacterium]